MGYSFLAHNHAMGNLGEQGKSILRGIGDGIEEDQYEKLLILEPEFIVWVKSTIEKMRSGKYVFLGKKIKAEYGYDQFKWKEA